MPLEVRRLAPEHDRSRFRSGNADLDRFLARYAGQNQFRHHIGTTYVAVDDAGVIAGYATVAASELAPEAMPAAQRKRLPKYPVPVLRLARLAVDERAEGHHHRPLFRRAAINSSSRCRFSSSTSAAASTKAASNGSASVERRISPVTVLSTMRRR